MTMNAVMKLLSMADSSLCLELLLSGLTQVNLIHLDASTEIRVAGGASFVVIGFADGRVGVPEFEKSGISGSVLFDTGCLCVYLR